MSKNAAPEEKMGTLHTVVADVLLEQLEGTPIIGDDGEIIGRDIDPRIISSAITFLNNNKTTANPFLTDQLSEIEKRLRDRKSRFQLVKPDEAAERAAADG